MSKLNEDGGHLVPNNMIRAISESLADAAASYMDSYIRSLLPRRTWEQRLAEAIEERRIRNRLRRRLLRFRYAIAETPRRLRNARAALAGEWEAADPYDE